MPSRPPSPLVTSATTTGYKCIICGGSGHHWINCYKQGINDSYSLR